MTVSHGPVVHPTRLVPALHPSLRVIHVRHAKIMRAHGMARRARVVAWPGRSPLAAAAGGVRPAAPPGKQAQRAELLAAMSGGGGISKYPVPTVGGNPDGVAVTPDGTAWFAESGANKIGKVTAGGSFTEYPVPPQPGDSGTLQGITVGADGNLWFTTYSYIGRMTPSGSFTFFPITRYNYAYDITPGPDGNVWFTEVLGIVGYVTPAGAVTEFSVGSGINPAFITAGPGGLWFTCPCSSGTYVYHITTAGSLAQYVLPSSMGGGMSPPVPTGGCGSSAA